MSRWSLVPFLLAGVLGACGGSHSGASTTTATSAAAPSSTTTQAVPPKKKHKRPPPTKASNVRLPATYAIRQGGVLAPPVVSAPISVTIALTVVSSDGQAHRVRLPAPVGASLVVPARGRASASIAALKAGSYPIYVDGVRRGALVIGVAPGP